MKKLYKDRLLKLAKHHEKGSFGHKFFSMSSWNVGPYDSLGCGTVGCSIGECPIVFPKEWHFQRFERKNVYYPTLRGSYDTRESIWEFFGLNESEGIRLFIPVQMGDFTGPTKKQQAKRIREFVKKKELRGK